MKLLKYIERLELIHRLIAQRRTGTPLELARRLDLSVSRLARIIEELRDQGAPIYYDRSNKTYYYDTPFLIEIVVRFENLN